MLISAPDVEVCSSLNGGMQGKARQLGQLSQKIGKQQHRQSDGDLRQGCARASSTNSSTCSAREIS